MKLPLSLIRSFVHFDLPLSKIGETLTLLGIEVDRIYQERISFAKIVVVEIRSSKRHPQSEHLHVAEVSDGKRLYTVVCAAPNCRPGIKVPFAGQGAMLTDRDGMQRTIELSSIKGVPSDGMLCSAQELQLFEEGDKILELPKEMEVGADLAPLVWDPILELSLTPNLGHCMSALGVARELAAALQLPLRYPKTRLKESEAISIENKAAASVENADLCPRYMCRLIENVKIGESPFWLRKALESSGMKSINNAVDVANFTMLKMGQPFHVFDFDRLEGKSIRVHSTKKPQEFLGLDQIKREIPAGTLVISDKERVVAIAGVLGGDNSAVNQSTTNILIEAAYFDPMTVRTASKKMGIRTESSQRFEKGIDPIGLKDSLDEMCALLCEVCGGILAKGSIDQKKTIAPKQIRCRGDRANQILGTKLSLTEIEEIFQRLDFKVKELDKGVLLVDVPLYRSDIAEEIDLIEEIARIYGYNNIEKGIPKTTNSQIGNDPFYLFENEMRSRLSAFSLQEFLTCDLISPKLAEVAQEIAHSGIEFLKTLHSKSEEYSVLRTSLLPALLQVIKGNIDQKNSNLHAFEIGRIHFLQQKKLVELPMAALLLTGKADPHNWSQKPKDVDFYDLKGMLENLMEGLQITPFSIDAATEHLSFHPGRQANIRSQDNLLGSFGEIHPSILEKFDIKQRVYYAELNLAELLKLRRKTLGTVPPPQFPASQRDWTIPLSSNLLIDTIFQNIHSSATPLLEKVELIDLYIPESGSQKNATLRFTYRDRLKTISFEEVEAEHTRLMEKVINLLAK